MGNRTAWGWTKGTAVRLIFGDVGATNAALLYAGDGANDIDAMEIVTAMGGIALGIGPHPPTASQYSLPNPATLLNSSAGWMALWKSGSAPPHGPPRTAWHCMVSGHPRSQQTLCEQDSAV